MDHCTLRGGTREFNYKGLQIVLETGPMLRQTHSLNLLIYSISETSDSRGTGAVTRICSFHPGCITLIAYYKQIYLMDHTIHKHKKGRHSKSTQCTRRCFLIGSEDGHNTSLLIWPCNNRDFKFT